MSDLNNANAWYRDHCAAKGVGESWKAGTGIEVDSLLTFMGVMNRLPVLTFEIECEWKGGAFMQSENGKSSEIGYHSYLGV